jgi:transmembrane sensor
MTSEDLRAKQAIQLLIEFETSGHSVKSWEKLESWIEESPINREVFSKVECAWRNRPQSRHIVPSGRTLSDLDPDTGHHPNTFAAPGRKRYLVLGATALFIAAVSTGVGWLLAPSPWRPYDSAMGQVKSIPLQDYVSAALNGDTRISTRTTWGGMDVRLERGEVAFDVTPHRWRSLSVYVNNAVLQDTGTRFEVLRVSDDRTEMTVAQGAVVVSSAPTTDSGTRAPRTIQKIVSAGESVIVSSGQITPQRVTAEDLDRKFAWTQGMLVLNGTLGDAVAAFNQLNKRKLVIADQALLSLHVGGRYQARDPDGFAKDLEQTHKIISRWNQSDDTIVLGCDSRENVECHVKKNEVHAPANQK